MCGEPLIKISRLPVCDLCLDAMHPVAGGLCSVCGERLVSPHAFTAEHGETRCGLCRRMEPPFARAIAYGSYESGLRDLVHLLKYQQVRPAANVLGRMLAEVIGSLEPSFAPRRLLMVPVPSAAREFAGCPPRQASRNSVGNRNSAGRRRLRHRHHSCGVRADSPSGWSCTGLGRDRGAYLEDRSPTRAVGAGRGCRSHHGSTRRKLSERTSLSNVLWEPRSTIR